MPIAPIPPEADDLFRRAMVEDELARRAGLDGNRHHYREAEALRAEALALINGIARAA